MYKEKTMNVNWANWKTTIAGLLGATANLVIAYLQGGIDGKTCVISLGLAILGYFSKDASTGSKPTTPVS